MSTAVAVIPDHSVVKRSLINLAISVLRPLIRILLRHGMSCQEFTEISRWVYVDVAMNDKQFALKSRSKTFKSRAAVLTGLSRKEVLRLSEMTSPSDLEELPNFNRAARVMTGWTENPMFSDGKDKPKLLPIKGEPGSFHDLVRLYSGDVPPRAVLDELRRCKAVEIIDADWVRLKRFQYFPEQGSEDELDVVATCASDLLATLDHNVNPASETKFLQREALSSRIPAERQEEVAGKLYKMGEEFGRKVHHYLSAEEDKVKKSGRPYVRVGLGVYTF